MKQTIQQSQSEQLEVTFYNQTIKFAQNNEVLDNLLVFIEEFCKRVKQQTSKESIGVIEDCAAFQNLPNSLKQEVNNVLTPLGFNYN